MLSIPHNPTIPCNCAETSSIYIEQFTDVSAHSIDQDIGYGPALEATDSGHIMDTKYEDDFHPPAPPISTAMGGKMEAASEVLKFDSNFLMARPGESNEIRHVSVRVCQGLIQGGWIGYLVTPLEFEMLTVTILSPNFDMYLGLSRKVL